MVDETKGLEHEHVYEKETAVTASSKQRKRRYFSSLIDGSSEELPTGLKKAGNASSLPFFTAMGLGWFR